MFALLSTVVGLEEAAEVGPGVPVLISVLPDVFSVDGGPATNE